MALSIRTGVSHDVWLSDTRALATAVELIAEADRAARSRGR